MTPPTDRAWEQKPAPSTIPRYKKPLNFLARKQEEFNRGAYENILEPWANAGSKLYDWLTESVARP